MSTDNPICTDSLLPHIDQDTQRLAARMAQEIFATCFRESVEADSHPQLAELTSRCRNWCQAGSGEEASTLRLVLLISGLDQWGLAYCQAFGITALPALSALIGALRTGLDSRADARFQGFFGQLEQVEADAIDFKIELRRQIHLALWHAMAACDDAAASQPVLQTLGSLMLALNERMPELGWRLVADALAHIQIRLLSDTDPGPQAQAGTQTLFAALRGALPQERHQAIQAHATQAVLAWQQARRQA